MSRVTPQQGLKPSILDRLIDPESDGTAWRPGYGLQQMLSVLRRDLEELLNTRQTARGPQALQRSIYAYGLPDLTSFEAITPQQKMELGEVIRRTVMGFEPRLQHVQVTLVASEEQRDRVLQFRIDAQFAVEPFDDVTFQTLLELKTGHYSVQQGGS
jgi:type VI secretion system protein ImpF